MPYDVFISYKSEDRPWAEHLHAALTAGGMTAFFDKDPQDGLIAARPWEAQLDKALAESHALVALWSQKAAQMNTWNDRERYVFDQPELRTPLAKGRPVIYVLLDAEPTALSATEFVADLKTLGAYPDVAKVPDDVWERVAERIRRAARSDDVVYVETLVLAATEDEMTQSGLGNEAWKRLAERRKQIGLPDDPVEGRYGKARWDWKPYGTASIKDILTTLKKQAQDNAGVELEFEEADEQIWSLDEETARLAGRRLAGKLALILIDPLSLYAVNIQSRIAFLDRCQQSPTNAFAVLAPHAANDDPLNFLVENYISGLYRSFFTPPRPPADNFPSVGMNIRSARELLRVLLMAHARGDTSMPLIKPKHTKTSMGRL